MLRASDSDRDRIVERLRQATGEGRLLAEELEDRLGAAFSARTYGELDALVADLPAPRERRGRAPLVAKFALVLAAFLVVLAVVAALALVLAGLMATWVVWLALGWLFLGRHRGGPWSRHVGCSHASRRVGRGPASL